MEYIEKEKIIKTLNRLITVSESVFEKSNYVKEEAKQLKGKLFNMAREYGYLSALNDILNYVKFEGTELKEK